MEEFFVAMNRIRIALMDAEIVVYECLIET